MTTFNVGSGNTRYSSENGVVYSKAKDTIVAYPTGKTGAFTIPYGVMSIGSSAFYSCSDLTSVEIPNSVTSIGDQAFYSCSGLTSVEIPNSVTSIGDQAFQNCSGLTSVTIGNSVTSIRSYTFSGCSGLTTFNVGSGNIRYSSENGVVYSKAKDTIVAYPTGKTGAFTIPNSVTSIGDQAFYSCIGLTSVEIPNSVTSIGSSAFSGCSGLTSVEIPNSVTSIGNYAFSGCNGLSTVNYNAKNIPNFSSASNSPFYNTISIVNIGDSVQTLPNYVFSGCSNLLIVKTTCTTPQIISSTAFPADLSNRFLFVPETAIDTYKAANVWKNFGTIVKPDTVAISWNIGTPNATDVKAEYEIATHTLTISGTGAMKDYTYESSAPWRYLPIKTAIIQSGVTSIGSSAFSGCSGLTSVTIPNSVTSIGSSAFSGCSGLTSVTIPNSVTSIGDWAFQNCSGLTSVTIGNSVTSIGSLAFSGCSGLTSVTIPNSVTSIGSYAFYNCIGLTTVNFNADSCASFSSNVWYNDTNIVTVNIGNNVKVIPNYAFYNFRKLTSITIPNSVMRIGDRAFYGCSGVTGSLTIPNGVMSIGIAAFQGCSGLTGNLTIPNSVTSIAGDSFQGCKLTSFNVEIGNIRYKSENGVVYTKTMDTLVAYPGGKTGAFTIPNSVTSIEAWAFADCSGLTGSLTIPNSVTSIGEGAFYRCIGLTSVTNLNPVPQTITSDVFTNVSLSSDTLYVPTGSLAAYQAADVWKEFGTITSVEIDSLKQEIDALKAQIAQLQNDTLRLFTAWQNALAHPDTTYLTLYDTIHTIDTAYSVINDTILLYDTIFLYDTVYLTDTVYIVISDTIPTTNSVVSTTVAVAVFPNPTTGMVYIETNAQNPVVTVYDINGNKVAGTIRTVPNDGASTGHDKIALDLSPLPSGTYIIHVDGQYTKVVKK
ncbi:hypothetical protein FACS1894201_05160 [Bacteroidia bacterium]|nr:hypothetical protein FACS1894201_05160 [Bacteroidia bacterium]